MSTDCTCPSRGESPHSVDCPMAAPDTRRCHYCGVTAIEWAKQGRELRPYGPGGSDVCLPCIKANPDRERAAHGVYGALLDATSTVGLTAIGDDRGPRNVDPRDVR